MPHSATFTDIDGDCMPDLFLTKSVGNDTVYELYSQRTINSQQMYCLVQTDSLSQLDGGDGVIPQIPIFDFVDMDRDAMVDMVFFRDGSVYTFYNHHSANGASDTNLCQQAIDTSVFISQPLFSNFSQALSDKSYVTKQNIFSGSDRITDLAQASIGIPGRLHIADIDADGYPDLLLTG